MPLFGFPPITSRGASTLVLGSMPGGRSLQTNQYYAHPQNAFWRIMGHLLNFDSALPYALRLEKLNQAGIAVWDVLQSCERSTSLDSDIVASSIEVNDFSAFYQQYPNIRNLLFNGAKAEELYLLRVRSTLPVPFKDLAGKRLPSTSPANATSTFEQKLAAWRRALNA